MKKKTEEEMRLAEIVKVTRSVIRLKHSIEADREINDTLPDLVNEFEIGLQSGQLLELPDGWAEEISDEILN